MAEPTPTIKNNSDKRRGRMAKSFVAGIVAFALLAGVAWILTSKRQAHGGQASAAPAVQAVMHLEGFVVNLADPPGDCFLRIGIDLGLGHSIARHGEKEIDAAPTARVRDVILRVLTTYQSNELLAPAGKIRLKQQLLEALQAAAPELEVREVYFTDFLVQR
jgi:flagellar FliL protein